MYICIYDSIAKDTDACFTVYHYNGLQTISKQRNSNQTTTITTGAVSDAADADAKATEILAVREAGVSRVAARVENMRDEMRGSLARILLYRRSAEDAIGQVVPLDPGILPALMMVGTVAGNHSIEDLLRTRWPGCRVELAPGSIEPKLE
jgi:hypothetical protein